MESNCITKNQTFLDNKTFHKTFFFSSTSTSRVLITIPAGHELVGLFTAYTTPYLQMNNLKPSAAMRDFMTTLSKVPICVPVEPSFDPKYGVDPEPIPTLVPGLIAELFFMDALGDTSHVASGEY